MSVDPLAEKYRNTSPYSYVANNPITNIEIDGRFWWSSSDKKMADGLRKQYNSNLTSLNKTLTKINAQMNNAQNVGTKRELGVRQASINDQITANSKAISNLDKLEKSEAFGFNKQQGNKALLEFAGIDNHSTYGESGKVSINYLSDSNATHEINHAKDIVDGKLRPSGGTNFKTSSDFSYLDAEVESYQIEFGVYGIPKESNSDSPLPTRPGLLTREHVKSIFARDNKGNKNYPYKNLE